MHSPGKRFVGVGSIASRTGFELSLCERHYQGYILHTDFVFICFKSNVCMLSSEDIVTELITKHTKLLKKVEEFVCVTPDCRVQLALCKMATRVCEGFFQNLAFLFPCVYSACCGFSCT